jgi:hypothetical protein
MCDLADRLIPASIFCLFAAIWVMPISPFVRRYVAEFAEEYMAVVRAAIRNEPTSALPVCF